MAPTSFPGAIDSFTNPAVGNPQNAPSHAGQHANINDSVKALETLAGTTAAPGLARLSATGSVLSAVSTGATSVGVGALLAGGTVDVTAVGAGAMAKSTTGARSSAFGKN